MLIEGIDYATVGQFDFQHGRLTGKGFNMDFSISGPTCTCGVDYLLRDTRMEQHADMPDIDYAEWRSLGMKNAFIFIILNKEKKEPYFRVSSI